MNSKQIISRLPSALITALVFTVLLTLPVLTVNHDTGYSFFKESLVQAAAAERRAPPEARSSQTLSTRVSRIILEAQEFQQLEDYPSALEELSRVKEMYDNGRLNDIEQYTMWQFYAFIAQITEDYPLAIEYFIEMANLGDNLTSLQLESTLRSLAQLYSFQEQHQDAIDAYLRYIDIVEAIEVVEGVEPRTVDADVYLRLATSHYLLEEYTDSIPYLLQNMALIRAGGEPVIQSTYTLLRAMYIILEDFSNARQVLREMIVLFDDQEDWIFLSSIESMLERDETQSQLYYVSNVKGYLDTEAQLVTLAAILFNYDDPYGSAVMLQKGLDDGIIEENEDILNRLAVSYRQAREDAMAVAPLTKAAEMSEDGELYTQLGSVYYTLGDFESAAEAYGDAIEKGGLSSLDTIYIRQAQAYWELDRYDEALEAAEESGSHEDLERGEESTSARWVNILENEKRKYDTNEANRILYEGFFL